MILWTCALENRADLCENEGRQLCEYRVSATEEEGENLNFFSCVWFSRYMWYVIIYVVLVVQCISHMLKRLESVPSLSYFMYYIHTVDNPGHPYLQR